MEVGGGRVDSRVGQWGLLFSVTNPSSLLYFFSQAVCVWEASGGYTMQINPVSIHRFINMQRRHIVIKQQSLREIQFNKKYNNQTQTFCILYTHYTLQKFFAGNTTLPEPMASSQIMQGLTQRWISKKITILSHLNLWNYKVFHQN